VDRIAELARELLDEAVRRVEQALGDGPHGSLVRGRAIRTAQDLCETAIADAAEEHRRAAVERHRNPPVTPG